MKIIKKFLDKILFVFLFIYLYLSYIDMRLRGNK